MGKYNVTRREGMSEMPNTTNLAGGAAFAVKDSRAELASIVLASMLKGDTYYQTDESRQKNIFEVAKKVTPEFLAKAMIYTRQEGNLRSVSHLMANALVENGSGMQNMRSAFKKAIVRPDDMTEMAALWFSRHPEKMLPNAMRRAFKDLLDAGKWDAYQLNKYKGISRSVKLKDIIKLSHPVDREGLYKSVIEDNIKAPQTLETKLAGGQKASEAVGNLLSENRLGYMAAVKNIRNALSTGISDSDLDTWCKLISDPKKVAKSRMLPYRFVDAWNSVKDLPVDHFKLQKVRNAFDEALKVAALNLEFVNSGDKFGIIIDHSGSMNGQPWKNAIILAAVLYHALGKENVVVYHFADTCEKLDFGNASPIDIIEHRYPSLGYSTPFHVPMEKLISTGTFVDKLIVLTDMQLYDTNDDSYPYGYGGTESSSFMPYLKKYKVNVNPKVKTLFWDLNGYGAGTPLQLKSDVLLASGFSDKLLSVIQKMWRDPNALVNEIEAINLT